MNLYKITFSHYAPKDVESGIKCLVLADNDSQVYDFIASEPKIQGRAMFNLWSEKDEKFKQKIIELKRDFQTITPTDTYYGITLYGWELLKENTQEEYKELIELGIVIKLI